MQPTFSAETGKPIPSSVVCIKRDLCTTQLLDKALVIRKQRVMLKILWFTWKDLKNPLSGGAEVVNEEMAKRLAKDGHNVIFVTAGFPGCKNKETVNGYEIIRVGTRWSVYWEVYKYYKENLTGWADLVIDEMNTIPFFAKFYVKEKNIMFVPQLCRQIWFYQIFFPLNIIGYLIEPIYLRLLNDRRVITISASSKKDLLKYGFKQNRVSIISMGTDVKPVPDLKEISKYKEFTILSLGAIREMKRPHHQIKAFEIAKKEIPELKLIIAGGGSGKYFNKVMELIENSPYKKDIEYLGKISEEKKIDLMQKCHLITVTSVKEGWGLVVTEANSQGTIAAVYNGDGLRDSTKDKVTGLVTKRNNLKDLAEAIIKIYKNKADYERIRTAAWAWSKEITFDNCYKNILETINGE